MPGKMRLHCSNVITRPGDYNRVNALCPASGRNPALFRLAQLKMDADSLFFPLTDILSMGDITHLSDTHSG